MQIHALFLVIATVLPVFAFGHPGQQQQVPLHTASTEYTGEPPSAPIWPQQFSVSFLERSSGLNPIGKKQETRGQYWYDATRKATVVERENGQHDRYCSSIHPFRPSPLPCKHVVTEEGTRWMVFPSLEDCCLCCFARNGCGSLKPNWLEGAQFLGQEACPSADGLGKDETLCNKWDRPGLQSNFYWEEAETRIPRRILQMPNDDQIMNGTTFLAKKPPTATFKLPAYCHNARTGQPKLCPAASVCGVVRRST